MEATNKNSDEWIRLEGQDWPIIDLGYGLVEVAEGRQGEKLALIFGRNGSGEIGAPTQPDRVHLPGETLAVVTFANVESLDVVVGKLKEIRKKLIDNKPSDCKTKCQVCLGKGYTEEWREVVDWSGWLRSICEECNGTGKVEIE